MGNTDTFTNTLLLKKIFFNIRAMMKITVA